MLNNTDDQNADKAAGMGIDPLHPRGQLVQTHLIEIFKEKYRIPLITSSILSVIVAVLLRNAVDWNLLAGWLVVL
ncbi:MAG: hypothetical protein HOI98_13945, partial [Rhodospirillaceae bacterium]|nr:hypothetical protein [Rhodospirillaceae bacterium]